ARRTGQSGGQRSGFSPLADVPNTQSRSMRRSNDTRVYFVQVRPAGSRRWQTQAIGGSEDEARRLAQRDWSLPIAKARGELRVIGDAELERHGGLVAVMEAIASFH